MHSRRSFLEAISLTSAGAAFASKGLLANSEDLVAASGKAGFNELAGRLLKEWCDGMLANQINDPDDSVRDGALGCPSCDFIHGRCWEAVYPFLHVAKVTGDRKYLEAGVRLFDWSKNVSDEDGRWRNDLKPGAWHGTAIFGAIALAEAIKYHGDLLSDTQLAAWKERLGQAASGYLWKHFAKIDFTNVNYGFTAVHGFHLIGHVLGEQRYIDRSHAFAKEIPRFFTEPNKLLFGEGKPYNVKSARGLLPVDLGYNVEESLNGVVLYALEENDEELLKLLQQSLEAHLEFMLPDGGWDNSWGTRQFKWTYWGSRTSDGCQPSFALMADRNPALGTAAYRNLELYDRCTADGLLHGGPHYISHGIKPCIHHTFAHAKVLAFVQDNQKKLQKVDDATPLPRELAEGVKEFPEIAVSLAAQGPWRATVSAYDSIYRTKSEPDHILHATGGSLSLLYHEQVGLLFAGSMPNYLQVEPLNQQENPKDAFVLTPRVETTKGQKWFTNLYDLKAEVSHRQEQGRIDFEVKATLHDEDYRALEGSGSQYELGYSFDNDKTVISATRADESDSQLTTSLVIPIISPSGEKVIQVSKNRIEIIKPGGKVVIEANTPLEIAKTSKGRAFNMVPGAEAIPISTQIPEEAPYKAVCTVFVEYKAG